MARASKISDGVRAFTTAKMSAPDELYFHIEKFALDARDQFEAVCQGQKQMIHFEFSVRALRGGFEALHSGGIPMPPRTKKGETAKLLQASEAILAWLESTPTDYRRIRAIAAPFGMAIEEEPEEAHRVLDTFTIRCRNYVYYLLHPD